MDGPKQLHWQQHKEISRSDEIHFGDSLVLITFNPCEVRFKPHEVAHVKSDRTEHHKTWKTQKNSKF